MSSEYIWHAFENYDVSSIEKLILIFLGDNADYYGITGYSLERLAKRGNMDQSVAHAILDSLMKKSIITPVPVPEEYIGSYDLWFQIHI